MAKPFLIQNPLITVFDNSGVIVPSGAQVFIYNAGTTTKSTTYPTQTDAINGTNANANPIIADASGRVPTAWATQAVKIVPAPSTDSDPPVNSYWTRDNVTSMAQTVVHSLKTTTYAVTASDRDSLIECDASGGSFVVNLLSASSAGDGFNIKIKKIDSSSNTVTVTCNGVDLWNGNASVILYNQYEYIEAYSDGAAWQQTDNINVPVSGLTQCMGAECLFAKSAGTWTITRNAEANYSNNKTANAETAIVGIDVTNAINVNAGKGFKLTSYDLIYSIGTANLTAHTVTLDQVTYANNVAVAVTSVPSTGSLATTTQSNPYVSSVTVTTPAYNNTAVSRYIIEVTVQDPGTSVYKFYGANLHFTRNDR